MSGDRPNNQRPESGRPEERETDKREVARVSTAVLAYIGDAVYEVQVRKHVFRQGLLRPERLHLAAVRYVRAEAQAAAFDVLWDGLSPDEQAVARRGKNHRITSMPHNVEALIGYLELAGDEARKEYLIEETFRIVESSDIEAKRFRGRS